MSEEAQSEASASRVEVVQEVQAAPLHSNEELSDAGGSANSAEDVFNVYVQTPDEAGVGKIQIQVGLQDTVADIKQFLYETAETCYFTNYSLHLANQKLNDFAELATLGPALKNGVVFEMHPSGYDERSARHHVKRLHHIITSNLIEPETSPTLFSYFSFPDADPTTDQQAAEAAEAAPATDGKKKGKAAKNAAKKAAAAAAAVRSSGGGGVAAAAGEALGTIDQEKRAALRSFYPPLAAAPPSPVSAITHSGWNPPPGARRLAGDLFYIDVALPNGEHQQVLPITACLDGFYVNNNTSAHFDPTPAPAPAPRPLYANTLAGLLSAVSRAFKAAFRELLNFHSYRHPFEGLPVIQGVHPWLGRAGVRHTYDYSRAEDFVTGADIDGAVSGAPGGQLRDWNEEFQSVKELPRVSPQERQLRDRALVKVHADFVHAATHGAMAVVNKSVRPLNAHEEERAHMYLHNNIFFSYAIDVRDLYKDAGGDSCARRAAGLDMHGVRLYNAADVEALHIIQTALIDYRGHRIVAQGIVPGILTSARTAAVVYGSLDNGTTLAADAKFHELLAKAAPRLHVGAAQLVDAQGGASSLYCSTDTKGIVGSDGRHYLIDLPRTTPRDHNYPNDTLALLRPELVQAFAEYRHFKELLQRQEAQQQQVLEKENEKGNAKDEVEKSPAAAPAAADKEKEASSSSSSSSQIEQKDKDIEEDKLDKEKTLPAAAAAAAAPAAAAEKDEATHVPALEFNVNVFTNARIGGSVEERARDEALVVEASQFLHDVALPAVVDELAQHQTVPFDGAVLVQLLHGRGVNVRYLGAVAKLLAARQHHPAASAQQQEQQHQQQHQHAATLRVIEQEVVARAAKDVFAQVLRDTPARDHLAAVVHFLNCLLGTALPPAAAARSSHQQQQQQRLSTTGATSLSSDVTAAAAAATAADKKSKKSAKKAAAAQKQLATAAAAAAATSPQSLLPLGDGTATSSGGGRGAVDVPVDVFALSSDTLWERVAALALSKFGYTLEHGRTASTVALLRAVCLQTGLKVAARDYEFPFAAAVGAESAASAVNGVGASPSGAGAASGAGATPFTAADIIDLYPRVKHINPRSTDGAELFEAGRVLLAQGRIDVAAQVLSEALNQMQLVHGPMHVDVATCYNHLAMVLGATAQHDQAIDYQKRATIILEKVLALDAFETAMSYGALAQYCLYGGRTREGLHYMHRCLYLHMLIAGPNHPETPSLLVNAAELLLASGQADRASDYLTDALRLNETLYGPSSLPTAAMCHQLAVLQDTQGQYKDALTYEKRNNAILSQLVGEHDARTQESNEFLLNITQRAVQKQKEIVKANMDVMARHVMAQQAARTLHPRTAVPIATTTTGSSSTAAAASLGTMPLSEVLRYINGGSDGPKRKKKVISKTKQ